MFYIAMHNIFDINKLKLLKNTKKNNFIIFKNKYTFKNVSYNSLSNGFFFSS
jgi:hypothetical protein